MSAHRARSASICPLCSGPVRVGDPVRAWSLSRWAHEHCYLKDRELADATGTAGVVTGVPA